ncbi:MAG: TonB-dependent receptor [Bacteroidetes bacterium]|jgi:outer membrane receptor protein involved in Fe transport|nr:TonB-dependent receptor [Bacteroidota bacterium]
MNTLHRTIAAFVVLVFTAWSTLLVADTKGKITGVVTDDRGDPLPGVNILLVGTGLGASTDLEGYYVILNVPPGVFQVRVAAVGYTPKLIERVRISSGETTQINAVLSEQAVEMNEVVVRAERPLVDMRQTSSVTLLGEDQISVLPVQELNDIVSLQAGVVDGHFRGGRSGEVQYQVDGVSVNNPYDNSSTVKLDRSVLQEVQVISGTFDAEYGQAMSGVVNAVLKSGSEEGFEWNAESYGGDYLGFGTSARYPHLEKVSPFAIQNYQASVSGPTPFDRTTFLVGVRRFVNEGYLFAERRFMPGDSSDFETQTFRPTGDGDTVPLQTADEWSGYVKVMNQSLASVQISYQALGNIIRSQRYDHRFRLNPEGVRKQRSTSLTHGIDVTHMLANEFFYTLSLRENRYRYTDYVFEDVFDPRYLDFGEPRRDPNYDNGAFVQGVDLSRFKQETTSWIIKGAMTLQATRNHMVKLGGEAQWSKITFGPPGSLVPSTVAGRQVLVPIVDSRDYPGLRTFWPVSAAVFAQDRIEFADFLIRAGVRAEYFDARAQLPDDLQNPANAIAGAPTASLQATTKKVVVAPRFGMSYPLSDQGAVYFSYGHFYQMPGLGELFSNSDYTVLRDLQAGVVSYGVLGNPNLRPEFTTQYEFGVKNQFGGVLGADLSVYYKDIRDLLGVEFVSTYSAAEYARLTNVDFGDVVGTTVALDYHADATLTVGLDYTYQMAMGNSSDARETATRAEAGEDPRPRRVPLTWDQRHTLNASIIIADPGDYSLTSIVRFGTGQPYTPTVLSRLGANLETNSARKDAYVTVDVRAEKNFTFSGVRLTVFARAFNVFGEHTVNGFVFGDTGSPDYSLNRTGNAALLTDPSRFYQPRRVELGISFSGRGS